MVINNDPTYAYLLAANHIVDQKLSWPTCAGTGTLQDNFSFAYTNRKMVDEMANHAARFAVTWSCTGKRRSSAS